MQDNNLHILTSYKEGYQYKQNKLQSFPTAEGYVRAVYCNNCVTQISYQYVYNYTDHLGNIRLSYTQTETGLKTLEENHYYPFGLKHQNYTATLKKLKQENNNQIISVRPAVEAVYNYKYNGKELQDAFGLNWYDYGARNYTADVPHFTTIDPLAEDFASQPPYVYAANNSVKFIDKDGMAPKWIVGKDKNVNNGRATYVKNSDGTITWINATNETQRIGNSMLTTTYGTRQFNKWMASPTKVNLKYKKGFKNGAHAKTKPKSVRGKLLDNNSLYFEVDVVFYEKAIENALSDGRRYDGATKDEAEGSIGSHEVDHIDPEQIELDKATNTDEEMQSPSKNKPFNSEVKFRREYHKKHPNKGKKNWEEPYKKRGYEGNN